MDLTADSSAPLTAVLLCSSASHLPQATQTKVPGKLQLASIQSVFRLTETVRSLETLWISSFESLLKTINPQFHIHLLIRCCFVQIWKAFFGLASYYSVSKLSRSTFSDLAVYRKFWCFVFMWIQPKSNFD